MTSVSLYVELKAKSGKEEEVAAFLAGAQSLVDPASIPRTSDSCSFQAALEVRG
jgi:hypothetical protein